MNLNLQPQISVDLDKIVSMFLSDVSKWCKKDSDYIMSKDGKYIISFFPELLTYVVSHNFPECISNIWIGCRIMLHNKKDDHQQYCEEFLKYVKSLGLKTFEDTEAFCKNFSVNKNEEFTNYVCYFNPDFPHGIKTANIL